MSGINSLTERKKPVAIVDAPNVSTEEGEKFGDVLLQFYRALGWNGDDIFDPYKVRTTKEVYNGLLDQVRVQHPDVTVISAGLFMMNKGPGVDGHIPPGKVYLLDGWTMPSNPDGGISNAN